MVLLLRAEKVAKKMKASAVSGYSNDSNPFGDPNLTEKYAHSPPPPITLHIALVMLALPVETWVGTCLLICS